MNLKLRNRCETRRAVTAGDGMVGSEVQSLFCLFFGFIRGWCAGKLCTRVFSHATTLSFLSMVPMVGFAFIILSSNKHLL